MKRRILCIAFLTLFALCVPLFLTSSDVNALRHDVDMIPVAVPRTYTGSHTVSEPFYIQYNQNSTRADFMDNYFFFSEWDSGQEHCIYQSYSNATSFYSGGDRSAYGFPYYFSEREYRPDQLDAQRCQQLRYFTNSTPMKWSSVPPYVFGTPNLRRLEPYWYQIGGSFLRDNRTVDGFHHGDKLDFKYMFKNEEIPNQFYELNIPLGVAPADFGRITVGRQIVIQGEFLWDSANPNMTSFNISSDINFTAIMSGYSSNSDWVSENVQSQVVDCNWDVHRNPNANEYPVVMSYTCPISSQYNLDPDYTVFEIRLNGGDNNWLWDYPATNWLYDASFVTTDGDNTPGTPFGEPYKSGKDIDDAPGAVTANLNDNSINIDGINYTASLIHLFGFSLINPFAPLFNLFTAQDSCVQIPTIAGMIHSNETEICPWFSTNTRNIVTPVLGLSSMMLVFGFVVRWLGGSSGNMFVDDDIKDTGHNFQLWGKKGG